MIDKINKNAPIALEELYILIDDSVLLTMVWELRASTTNKKLITFNDVNKISFETINYPLETIFYIDSELNDGFKGAELAKKLYNMGYRNLYLATGFPATYFESMPWIKKIVGKECPF